MHQTNDFRGFKNRRFFIKTTVMNMNMANDGIHYVIVFVYSSLQSVQKSGWRHSSTRHCKKFVGIAGKIHPPAGVARYTRRKEPGPWVKRDVQLNAKP